MWGALSSSFEATGKLNEAIDCLKRVLISQDEVEPAEYGKLAQLYDKISRAKDGDDYNQAAYFYKKYLQEYEKVQDADNGDFVNDANLFLSKYYKESNPELSLKYRQDLER